MLEDQRLFKNENPVPIFRDRVFRVDGDFYLFGGGMTNRYAGVAEITEGFNAQTPGTTGHDMGTVDRRLGALEISSRKAIVGAGDEALDPSFDARGIADGALHNPNDLRRHRGKTGAYFTMGV